MIDLSQDEVSRDQTVKLHYCFKQHLGEQLDPAKCSCRKWVTYEEAEQKIADGEADWLILSRTRVDTPEDAKRFSLERGRFNPDLLALSNKNFMKVCPVCVKLTETGRQLCKNCHGRGLEAVEVFWEELSRWQLPEPGGTIVMVANADDEGKFNLALHKKTPRVATLEGPNPRSGPDRLGQIFRAAASWHHDAKGQWAQSSDSYDAGRVEDYGLINLLELFGKPQNAALKDKTIELTDSKTKISSVYRLAATKQGKWYWKKVVDGEGRTSEPDVHLTVRDDGRVFHKGEQAWWLKGRRIHDKDCQCRACDWGCAIV
jgi:hypothetical protein